MESISKPIETIYEDIASFIVRSILEDWSTAWITVDVTDENVYVVEGWYQISGDMEQHSFQVHCSIAMLFSDLRKRIKRDDTNAWHQARLKLERDGGFRLEFTY